MDLDSYATGMVLREGEVHLWVTSSDFTAIDEALTDTYRTIMSSDERMRYQRFYFERDRLRFLVSRALVRTTLSRYAATSPKDWRFTQNEWGRPEIDPGMGCSGLRFNLSHTQGFIALAVTKTNEIGVDVEWMSRKHDGIRVADRFFSPSEVASLQSLPEERRRERFFDFWTLKESYIKARGMGLAIPLSQFSFALKEGAIEFWTDARLADNSEHWRFLLFRPSDDHKLALCIGQTVPFQELRVYRGLPLESQRRIDCQVDASSP